MSWTLSLVSQRGAAESVLGAVWPPGGFTDDVSLQENSTYWWKLSGSGLSPFEVALTVNGQVLSRDVESEQVVWFRWDVGFVAGLADVELVGAGGKRMQSRVIVDPARSKLVRREYQTMLHDILDDTRSLAATSGMAVELARGTSDIPIAKLEYLLRNAARLRASVLHLDKAHRTRLRELPTRVRLHSARGLTHSQWVHGVKTGRHVSANQLDLLPARVRSLVEASKGMLPAEIVQVRSARSPYRREHQDILGLVRRVQSALRRHINSICAQPESNRDEILLARCERAIRQLKGLESLAVFAGQKPRFARWGHSHLYRNVEPYRTLYRIQRDIRAGLSNMEGEFALVPLRETFRLYETWVSLRIARAAKVLDPSLSARKFFREKPDGGGLVFSLEGTDIEFLGRRIRYKPEYREIWRSTDARLVGSYSRTMIPDVVIETISSDEASPTSLLVLDAKYRVEAQINDAISSIHMYRDALVTDSFRGNESDGARATTAGLVIVPSPPAAFELERDWERETFPAVLFKVGYQTRFKIGALVMRPGMQTADIAAVLESILEQFGEHP